MASGKAAKIGTSRMIEASDGRRYAFADHNCFACGGTNPIGMHLAIELGEGTASTSWTPGPNFVGWEEKVHGGLLATNGLLHAAALDLLREVRAVAG